MWLEQIGGIAMHEGCCGPKRAGSEHENHKFLWRFVRLLCGTVRGDPWRAPTADVGNRSTGSLFILAAGDQ